MQLRNRCILLFGFIVLVATSGYGQFPSGKWYAVYGDDKAALLIIEPTVIRLGGGSPQFDTVHREIVVVDSVQKGQKIEILKLLPAKPPVSKILGRASEADKAPTYIILDLVRTDTGILELHFQKAEYQSAEEAELHAADSVVEVPFCFLSANEVRHSMSLKPLARLSASDMIAAMRASDDSLNALHERFKDQPEAAMFVMFISPPHVMQQALIHRGYNPFVTQKESEVIFAKLKEDPEVNKVMEELQKGHE